MNRKTLIPATIVALIVIGLVWFFLIGQIASFKEPQAVDGTQTSMHGTAMLMNVSNEPTGTLSEEERADILFVFEEEKMARDVYTSLGATWSWQSIGHVARSESMHMSAAGAILDRYAVAEPKETQVSGTYHDKQLQALYDQLMRDGSPSQLDAIKAGLYIEEFDIADIKKRMSRSDDKDVRQVYQYLLDGSYMHLRHFSMKLAQLGGTYEPKVLSKDEFAAIQGGMGGGMIGGGMRGGGMMGR